MRRKSRAAVIYAHVPHSCAASCRGLHASGAQLWLHVAAAANPLQGRAAALRAQALAAHAKGMEMAHLVVREGRMSSYRQARRHHVLCPTSDAYAFSFMLCCTGLPHGVTLGASQVSMEPFIPLSCCTVMLWVFSKPVGVARRPRAAGEYSGSKHAVHNT